MIRRFFAAAAVIGASAFLGSACGGSDVMPPPPDPCVDAGTPGPPPPARSGAAGAIDISSNSFYLFGGDLSPSCGASGGSQLLDDSWHFDTVCKRWDQLTTTMTPPARSGSAFALEFAPSRQRLIMIGGRGT